MLSKIKKLWNNRNNNEEKMVIGSLSNQVNMTETHLIAIARLLFIKPENLVREAKNNKANGEYILKMSETLEQLKGK